MTTAAGQSNTAPARAWRFVKREPEKESWTQFFIAADCATVFTIDRFSAAWIRRRFRKGVSAEMIEAFADVRTGRYDLYLDVSRGHGDAPYNLHRCNLLSPAEIAKVIAEQALARRR